MLTARREIAGTLHTLHAEADGQGGVYLSQQRLVGRGRWPLFPERLDVAGPMVPELRRMLDALAPAEAPDPRQLWLIVDNERRVA